MIYTADLAVDGQYTDLGWEGGQCAASNGEQTAEWRVDLGGVRSIHYIVIQYMTGNRVWGMYCNTFLRKGHSSSYTLFYQLITFDTHCYWEQKHMI